MIKKIINRFSIYLNTWSGFLILFFIGAIIYLPCFKSFFIGDYFDYLNALFYKNTLATCFAPPFIQVWSLRFIEALEFFLCYNLFGLNPQGYLILGMLFYFITIAAVYYFIFVLFKNRVLSFISSFLIIVHPAHIEKFGLMCAPYLGILFFSLTLLCYFISLNRGKKGSIFYIFSLLFYSFSVFTRADTLTLPLFILIYHGIFTQPFIKIGQILKRTGGFFLVAILHLWVRFPILGFWPSTQEHYGYDFFNLRQIIYNYKIFTLLAFKIISNSFNLVYSLPLYLHNLLDLKAIVILPIFFLAAYCLILLKKEDMGCQIIPKDRIKIFILGVFWYLAGLIPFVFIDDKLHYAIRHVQLSLIGLVLAISIGILEAYHRIYRASQFLAKCILIFLLVITFCSTFLISRRINVDKKKYNYCSFIDLGAANRKYISTIQALYPIFPRWSKVYLVDFPLASRIHLALPIFYNDKSMKTKLLTFSELQQTNIMKSDNVFVFQLLEKGKILDLTIKSWENEL